jgi:hypothetical protein
MEFSRTTPIKVTYGCGCLIVCHPDGSLVVNGVPKSYVCTNCVSPLREMHGMHDAICPSYEQIEKQKRVDELTHEFISIMSSQKNVVTWKNKLFYFVHVVCSVTLRLNII